LQGAPVRPATTEGALPWRQALQGMRPVMLPLAGIVLARSFMTAALTTYLPTFLSSEGAGLWSAGASLSLLEAAGVVGALLGGTLSDRLGRRWVLFISLLVTPLLMFAFLGLSGSARLPLLVPLGLTALCTGPVLLALVLESFPGNRALANGTYLGLSFLIRTGAVVVFGALGDAFGLRPAYTVSAFIPLLGLPLLLLLPERRRQVVPA
jgi:FSR family fosmidomycin resistance protein-like MFS transporter